MTNEEILKRAMKQSAVDLGCEASDFLKSENVIAKSRVNSDARRYLELPFECNLVSYGNNIVASCRDEYRDIVSDYINKYSVEHCFETPNMHVLNDAFLKYGCKACFMAEYFLPDMELMRWNDTEIIERLLDGYGEGSVDDIFSDGNVINAVRRENGLNYDLRLLKSGDFKELYTDEWSNALSKERKELDVLGVGAYAGDKLIGLAGCSADCDTMWQIGVDVLPEYRRNGIASVIVRTLAAETIKRDKVPFYCAAWSNIKSVRTAIKSGFKPAWVELTFKKNELVDEMNSIGGRK